MRREYVGFRHRVGGTPPWSRASTDETVGAVFATRRSTSLTAIAMSAVAVAAVPSIASAAERYASPTGGGSGCTSAVPCSLGSAVKVAAEGDEVIASPGDYALTDTIEDKAKITIRGVPGQPRPRLLFSGAYQTGLRLMHGSLLRDVEVQQAAQAAAVSTDGARLDRVVVRGGGDGSNECAVNLLNATIRDSIAVADTSPICSWAFYASTNTSDYRNVTAIATEPGAPAIFMGPSGTVTASFTNVIARGGLGGAGVSAVGDVPGGHVKVTVTHSNFGTMGGFGDVQVIDGGGNQQAAPKFVNPAAGDYRQAPGSVTIDAGIDQPVNGAFDIDGEPRRIDTTDIGADEFVRPVIVTTGPATGIGPYSATLVGSIDEIGVPTSYRFQYGPTTAYGSETPAVDLGSEITVQPVATTVAGLNPGTTYHFRLVATNKAGVGLGHDQTFTTPPAEPTPSSSSSSSTPAFAGVRLVSTRLTLSGKFITLKLSCPAGTVGGCSGQTKLSARRRTGTRRVALGKARFTMAAGARAKVRLRLSRAGLQQLAGVRRLRARGAVAAHNEAGVFKTTVANVTVRRREAR
jgi:hypothetical protein